MTRFFYFLYVLLLVSTSSLKAQYRLVGSPSVANFSRLDHQAGTQNWGILQDQRGIIYFANNKGLLEFDGTNWQIFPLPNQTIVRSLALSEQGRLYIGGQNELGFLEPDEQGKNVYTSLTHLIPEELKSFEDIWEIFIQPTGIFFCSEKAVFYLDGEQVQVIKPKGKRFENFFELEGKIFIQDQQEGLFRLEDQQLLLVSSGEAFQNERIIAILPYEGEESLVFTFSSGLFLMDAAGIRPHKTQANDFLIKHQAYCAIQLENGNYAIGTPQNGLLIIEKNGMPMMHLNEQNGLQNNTVLSISQDVQKNLWLGLDNGIDYAEINSPFSKIRGEKGIAGTGYASIVHDGKLYLGTNQGLFYTDWNGETVPMDIQQFKPVENALGQVWNINAIGDGIIVGQHKGASYLKGKSVEVFSTIQGAWKFMELASRPGYAIEGTYDGLYIYKNQHFDTDGSKSPDWQLLGKMEGFDESARIFEEDEDGNIWVSHAYKGLYKIKPADNLEEVEKLTLYNSSNHLPDDLMVNVTKIRKELLFTMPSGIFRYDKEKDQFIAHEGFNKIFKKSKDFHRLIEDETGNIWFSVGKEFGVLKVDDEGVFNKFEVLYFNQIQEDLVDGFEHVYAFDERNIFIGTEKGFVHYRPIQEKDIKFPFKILIRKVTSITEKDSTVFWGYTKEDQQPATYNFDYEMNDFRFSFSAPYYEKVSYLKYRYKLEGFESNWTEWLPKTEKEYTNLAAGDYFFKVQARNAYGQESKIEVFSFTISPPWYWAWYAKLSYFLLALLVFNSLIRYISRQEKKKTEAFKKEQTHELKQKEEAFKKEVEKSEGEIVKLRNEKLQTDIKHKNSQLASATMHLVQKSEILMKIKNDLNNIQAEANADLKKKIRQITRTIESDIQLDDNWQQFESYFDQVHENFFRRLRQKFPDLTPKDQKLCAYLRMNLTTKEIAPLLNISVRGVEISRYRLRKKLSLNSEVNLVAFIMDV